MFVGVVALRYQHLNTMLQKALYSYKFTSEHLFNMNIQSAVKLMVVCEL